jgi:hypothetical protein
MLVYKDRVLESIDALVTGTGTLTLDGEVDGFRDFSAIGNGNQCFYSLWEVDADGNPNGGWEVGIGQYTSSGSLLARLRVLASSLSQQSITGAYLQSATSSSDLSTYTFSAQNLGTAASDRYIIVGVTHRGTGVISTVTVDGIAAAELVVIANGSTQVGLYLASVPTGTSGDVVVTLSTTTNRCGVHMWRAVGLGEASAFDTLAIAANILQGAVEVPAGGFTVAVALNSQSDTFTWTGLTEDHDSVADVTMSAASKSSSSAEGITVSLSYGTGANIPALAVASFAPQTRINLGSGTKRVMCTVAAAKIKLPDVQMFTTAGTHTWVKPPGCKLVEVVLIGGGGGGGSGRKGATADAGRTGGRSGAGGGITTGTFDADDLGAVETVTVAAGGTGGVSQTTNSTDGNAGTNGGASTFGNWLRAGAGAAGGGGTTANQGAAVAGGNDSLVSLAGGSAAGVTASTGVGGSAANNTVARPTGGGSGGGLVQTTDALGAAGSGGTLTGSSVFPNAVAGGAAGTAGGPGGNGNTIEFLRGLTIGTGGGGGHGSATTDAGAGGNGGNYGAGGGGGGASKDATGNSGAGGDGATGACMVISS